MKITQFFGEVKQEMKKTTWPTGTELRKNTTTIFSVIVFFSLFFYVADIILDYVLNLI